MGSNMKAAVVVEAIVLVAALAFSLAYFLLGWYQQPGHILDIALIAVWVLVAALLLFVFWNRSLKREEMVRRFYLNKEWVYNHEIGYAHLASVVPSGDPFELVSFIADSLAQMSYGFEVAETPDDFVPDFLISSRSFQFHFVEDEDDLDEARGVIVDNWRGVLERVIHASDGSYQTEDIGAFRNARELSRLLEEGASPY